MANEVDIIARVRGAETIKDMKSGLKDLKRSLEETNTRSQEYKRLADEVANAENRLHQARRVAYGDQGKIKEAYFNSGAALRQFYMEQRVGDRTMRESASTVKMFASAFGVGGLSTGLETAIGAFQQTEFAVKGFAVAAESAGGTVGKLGAGLASMGTGAIAPLAAMAAELLIVKGIIDSTRESVDEYRAAAVKAGLLSERKELAREYGKARKQIGGFDSDMLSGLSGGVSQTLGTLLNTLGGVNQMRDRMRIRAQMQPGEYLGYDELHGGVGGSTAGTVLGEVVSTGTRGGATSKSPFAGRDTRIGAMAMRGFNGFRTSVTAGDRIKMGVQEIDTVQTKVDGINENILTIGSTLAESLTSGFQRGLDSGQNMFKSFVDSIIASMMGIAAQQTAILGISGLLSLIPGVGGFGAIAGAMGSMFFNTSGASASPITGVDATNGRAGVSQELRGIKSAVQNLELRVDNQGMYMASERGRVAFERA